MRTFRLSPGKICIMTDPKGVSVSVSSEADGQYDVFLSFKNSIDGKPTPESQIAKSVYEYFTARGIRTFHCTSWIGKPNFVEVVQNALQSAQVLVVIASQTKNIEATWVDTEWTAFFNLRAAENRKPQIFNYIRGFQPGDLPALLNTFLSIPHTGPESLESLYAHVAAVLNKPKIDPPPETKSRIPLVIAVAGAVMALALLGLFLTRKPGPPPSPSPSVSRRIDPRTDRAGGPLKLSDFRLDLDRTKGLSAEIDAASDSVIIRFPSIPAPGILFLEFKDTGALSSLSKTPVDVRIVGQITDRSECDFRIELEDADRMGYPLRLERSSDGRFTGVGRLDSAPQAIRFVFDPCPPQASSWIRLTGLAISR